VRYSQLLGKAVRDARTVAKHKSLSLLIKGGFIRPVGKGLYSYLPLGVKVLKKLKNLISMKMEDLGAQEVLAPLISPKELWSACGRSSWVGKELKSFFSRDGQELVLSPTHEELMVDLVRRVPHGAKELPLFIYQIQSKFRDEEKPWGGLIRSREFIMCDAYSFHQSDTCLNNFFPRVYKAYQEIFKELALHVYPAQASVGYMGGEKAYEFILPCEQGDVEVVICSHCGYTANREVAQSQKDWTVEALRPMAEIPITGQYRDFLEAQNELGVDISRMAKVHLLQGTSGQYGVILRGDQELGLEKVRLFLKDPSLAPMDVSQIESAGLVDGFICPLDLKEKYQLLVDEAVSSSTNLILPGAEGKSAIFNTNFGRDYDAHRIGDFSLVQEGEPCRFGKGNLTIIKALELGHIFKLGSFYSQGLSLLYQKESGESFHPPMGSYGIGIGRLLAALAYSGAKDFGIHWPKGLAPYKFFLMAIGNSPRVRDQVESLYATLGRDEALYDDRKISAGKKFQDCDLIGIPYRFVLTRKLLAEGLIECKKQGQDEPDLWPLDEFSQRIRDLI